MSKATPGPPPKRSTTAPVLATSEPSSRSDGSAGGLGVEIDLDSSVGLSDATVKEDALTAGNAHGEALAGDKAPATAAAEGPPQNPGEPGVGVPPPALLPELDALKAAEKTRTPEQGWWDSCVDHRLVSHSLAHRRAISDALLLMDFGSPTAFFQTSHKVILTSRFEWPHLDGAPLTDLLWESVVELHLLEKPIPKDSRPTGRPLGSPSGTAGPPPPSAAEVAAQTMKNSVHLSATDLIRRALRILPGDLLPAPQKLIAKLRESAEFVQAFSSGESFVEEFLDAIVGHRVNESLVKSSRGQYASGVHSWMAYCYMVGIPPEDHLEVTEAHAARWLSLHRAPKTAASYRSHLKFACVLMKKSIAWDVPNGILSKIIKGIAKPQGELPTERTRWACRRKQAILMVQWALDNDLPFLALVIILSYTFQFRVFSELFKLRVVDISVEGADEQLGEQKLRVWLDRRKNRPLRHDLWRPCTCKVSHEDGVSGSVLCPVHNLLKLREHLPSYARMSHLPPSGQANLTLLDGFEPSSLNPLIRDAARATGDPLADRASSHGFRRGMACDLALERGKLGEILAAGDWRSAAFRVYLESISSEMHAQALLHVLGETSDSEND